MDLLDLAAELEAAPEPPAAPASRPARAGAARPAVDVDAAAVDWSARAAEIKARWAASTTAARAKFEHPGGGGS